MRAGDRMRATYDFLPVDHLHRAEFGIWPQTLERWRVEGLPEDWRETNLFQFDAQGHFGTGVDLGWCEPPFLPLFTEEVLQREAEYDVVRDIAGRHVKFFRDRRIGFMPEYVDHPVKDMDSWMPLARRLDPGDEARWHSLPNRVRAARAACDAVGGIFCQHVIGGYMYLRALIGPEELLYAFYDMPEVVHAAMDAWVELVDEAIRRVQEITPIDEVFIAEDICYNHGLLISPDLCKEFLFPRYHRVLENARSRQSEHVRFHLDTDGDCRPAIELYSELGLDRVSPMEVASGCDVVEIGERYPKLIMSGGIDKRVLADGPTAIDAFLERVIPAMVRRGGYYPTCDHDVPNEVSLDNYKHYRRRMCELDHD